MMKISHTIFCVFFPGLFLLAGMPDKSDTAVNQRVADLLSRMTLEEKIGQMTQVTIQVVSKTRGEEEQKHELDPAKLNEAIVKYQVGSILNVWDVAHSIDYWHEVVTRIQDIATQKTRLKIPVLYGIDAIHGANYTLGATIFPQSLAMAATWNPELVRKIAEITAVEVRASGIPWNFNPVLDIGRQPLWPRLFETFGEDVYLAKTLGAEYVKGNQGDDLANPERIAACAKHYLGYSFPRTGKDRTPAWISDIDLREYFLPTFKAAVDAGVATLMVNSSEINGIPVHSSYYLLTTLLRDELGFKGVVVSDWQDINNLYLRERVAADPKEAVKMAVMAGIDMSMVPYDYSFYEALLTLVKAGEVPENRIDEAVSRILRLKFDLGLFENPYPNKLLAAKFATPQSAALNLQAACEAITLLKNDKKTLPLAKNLKVFVTGPTADKLSVLNSGWTITWQGNAESLYPKDKPTILRAIQQKIGAGNVSYAAGVDFDKEIDISAAVNMAKKANVAVVCIGEPAYCETPGNIDDLTMTASQLKLVEAIKTAGVPVVLVLAEGRPRIINRIVDKTDAIIMAYLPGMEGGAAVADILFGDVNPSGKLPISYPKFPNCLMNYDYKYSEVSDVNQYNIQFPFGFGLSYTVFKYSDLNLSKTVIGKGEKVTVSVRVQNVGSVAGKETVQLYLSDLVASVVPSVRKIKGFSKIDLRPGESKTATFVIGPDEMSFIGRDAKRIVEAGDFEVTIADLKAKFRLTMN
ncbi:MAG: glycoside hydrolase family 3 N-terminal domain-containing protein [Candidatus Neomarinimicrobiota bacterium]